jgi:hypothetical protein
MKNVRDSSDLNVMVVVSNTGSKSARKILSSNDGTNDVQEPIPSVASHSEYNFLYIGSPLFNLYFIGIFNSILIGKMYKRPHL